MNIETQATEKKSELAVIEQKQLKNAKEKEFNNWETPHRGVNIENTITVNFWSCRPVFSQFELELEGENKIQ